jgi:hypothetical protein
MQDKATINSVAFLFALKAEKTITGRSEDVEKEVRLQSSPTLAATRFHRITETVMKQNKYL